MKKVSYYLNVDMSLDQQCLINSLVLDTVVTYILKESSVKVNKNKFPHICLKLVDRCINDYTNILNYSKRLKMVI